MQSKRFPIYLFILALGLAPIGTVHADDEPTPAQRARSQNNLKQIALALHIYHDAHGNLPGNITDKNGKPLLSWRVAILPYVEEQELYDKFKLDEPWDSTHNKKLVEKMPKLYAPLRGKADENTTFYQMPAGEAAILNPSKKIKFSNITDGLSHTLMVLESADAVIWSKPEDLEFDAKKELPKLGGMFNGDFNASLGDGSVRYYKKNTDPKTLKAMMTIAGGEKIK